MPCASPAGSANVRAFPAMPARIHLCTLLVLSTFAALAVVEAAEPIAIHFSGSPGAYGVSVWKHDWPGCEYEDGVEEGRVTLATRDGVKFLRVAYTPGAIGPDKNGVSWRWPFAKWQAARESAEFSYSIRFGPKFEWVKGGKLPGLCGGPENVSGGHPATGTNGWSARLMWRAEGRGEVYVYHKNQPAKYGESFAFPTDFRYPTDTPIRSRLRVTMNQPGKRDGTLRVWIAAGAPEQLMVERTDLEWRTVGSFGVDSLYFETFYGGNESDWAPSHPGSAEFGEFRISFP